MTENTYVALKVTQASHPDKTPMEGMDGMKTMEAYKRNAEENGFGYTWYSTDSRIAQEKVEWLNKHVPVPILFVYEREIIYFARAVCIISENGPVDYPGERGAVPQEFAGEIEYPCRRTWLQIQDIQEEKNLKLEDFVLESNAKSLKEVFKKSQLPRTYVLPAKRPKT